MLDVPGGSVPLIKSTSNFGEKNAPGLDQVLTVMKKNGNFLESKKMMVHIL